MSPASIAKSNPETLQNLFPDEKLAKQILNAAKRTLKKRPSVATQADSPPTKHRKPSSPSEEFLTPSAIEASLALPIADATEEELQNTILYTNRAPLLLAFATALLKYTMPSQPISSRLSLAQALVSANSRSKAVSLGIDKGQTAEEEGWGKGQPTVRVMERDIRVLKRWGYEWGEESGKQEDHKDGRKDGSKLDSPDQSSSQDKPTTSQPHPQPLDPDPPLWGLDLEALRSSSASNPYPSLTLPIHTPASARSYLLNAFSSPASAPSSLSISNSTSSSSSTALTTAPPSSLSTKKSPSAASLRAQRSHNLALLLQALDLLYGSWATVVSAKELDRKSWGWYVATRPDVEAGVRGWGGRGEVQLKMILERRRRR